MSIEPIRHREFANGKLTKSTYKTPEGPLASEEAYAADGSKIEGIAYYTREDRRGQEYKHWWYDHGRPIKTTYRGDVVYSAVEGEG